MKISYDIYNVFYYVCKFKSITSAANYLHVSQPAVTRQIKNLEISLGYTLFIRTRKGLKLTSSGEELYKEVSKAIEIFNNIETRNNELKPLEEGTIKILSGYATTKHVLLPIIIKFNKLYPKIKIFMDYYPLNEAISKLRNGEVDILLLNTDDYFRYSDILFTPFYELNDILVATKEVKDLYFQKINLEDINDYPIICKKDSNSAQKFISEFLECKGKTFKPAWELNDYWLVEEYIKLNMGIGIVCKEFIKKELSTGEMFEIQTDIKLPKRHISYAIRKNCLLRPELIKLIHFFKTDNYER